MIKYFRIFVIFMVLSACGQNTTEMKTRENATEKFVKFIAKKKFIEQPYPYFYPEVADEKIRSIFMNKINQATTDFQKAAKSKNPTDKKYQEKLK